MPVEFTEFIDTILTEPILLVTVILTLGVIFVNGRTDAPNSIATCVATGCMNVRRAIIMSTVFDFFGIAVMTFINASVAYTVSGIADFGSDERKASIALCSALLSVIIYSSAAAAFGIPTSESHSLIAGLTGSAVAVDGGFGCINAEEWIKVIYGLLFSLLFGFFSGSAVCRLTVFLCRNADRRKLDPFFKKAQIVGAAATSFMHGAQDGQKFMGILMLGVAFYSGNTYVSVSSVPIWLVLLCSTVMAFGTASGGKKIIRSVGMDMVRTEKYQGFCADVSASFSLLALSLCGIPVSTTHTKTASVMGVGAFQRLSAIRFGVVKEMLSAWIFTFPVCGAVGYSVTKLLIIIL